MADTTVVTATPKVPSKGIQTTEFLLTAVVNVAGLVGTVAGVIPPEKMLIILGVVNVVYAVLRSLVKIFDPSYSVPVLPTAAQQ